MKKIASLTLISAAMLLTGCVSTGMQMGNKDAKTVATGGAAGASSNNVNTELERCDSPLGTIALIENQDSDWYHVLREEFKLPPTATLLNLLIQQSNCFVVVHRNRAAMNAMGRERDLQNSGEMRKGSNYGKGQMVSADYGLSPEIIFSQSDTGGMAASIGGLFGSGGRLLGQLAGSAKTREASALLTMIDNRSGVQIAASEGSASKMDFGIVGSLFGGSGGARAGGYTKTPQGKVIAAAFMDAYNSMVISLREYKAQSVKGQGLGGGGRLGVDGSAAPSQTSAPGAAPRKRAAKKSTAN